MVQILQGKGDLRKALAVDVPNCKTRWFELEDAFFSGSPTSKGPTHWRYEFLPTHSASYPAGQLYKPFTLHHLPFVPPMFFPTAL